MIAEKSDWPVSTKRALLSGASASLLSTAALALLGRRHAGTAYGPTNAVSHWFFGDKAARQDAPSLRYTVTGYLIHHASATLWALLLERLMGRRIDRAGAGTTLALAGSATAVACFTDYQLTPPRLHPGYEQRLPTGAVALVYAAFGVGLALGAGLGRRVV